MTIACCVCGRVKHGDLWVLRVGEIVGPVSHGYCPRHFGETMRAVRTRQGRATAKKARFTYAGHNASLMRNRPARPWEPGR
jgi:hypothetical protein